MTIYLVHEHHTTHTCPADPQPHPIAVARTIAHVTDGGPCRNPITIRCGDRTTTIPCGRHEPANRQCGACRSIVMVATVTTEHLGHDTGTHTTTPAAPAAAPEGLRCTVCGDILDPVLARTGRHLLCYPAPRRTRAVA